MTRPGWTDLTGISLIDQVSLTNAAGKTLEQFEIESQARSSCFSWQASDAQYALQATQHSSTGAQQHDGWLPVLKRIITSRQAVVDLNGGHQH